MDECIEAVRSALTELAGGEAIQPLRPVVWLPEGALGMMPGYLPSIDTIGIKTITVFPGNAGTPYDSHQGTVMLFDGEFGRLTAVIDATEITAIRTAAASAVATDALARPDASVLAILGSGVQAGTHLDAMAAVRPVTEVRIWSRSPANAVRLAASTARDGVEVRAVSTVAEAVGGADLVCTTTASHEPVLPGFLLEAGMHINAVGASIPTARELDGEALARSRLFVDRRESALNEAGDFLLARQEGHVSDADIVAEVGEVLAGSASGRQTDEEITLFKSLGLAVEDIAAGDLVFRKALAANVGVSLELGGARHA
ncbi:MAG: ornithine cyclodeaminase family protein [Acidimicrobiia bacterium]|nr:ornithine cyclodeaminase family protein [Acidimicrobiia bacterium]NNL69519.1 ornithine cyclodeaminase family protein [Acidimicrobiia bacterium]